MKFLLLKIRDELLGRKEKLFGKGTRKIIRKGVVEQIGGVVDKFVRTKDEKAQFEKRWQRFS